MLGNLVREPGRGKMVGRIEEAHEEDTCPDGIESCKGYPIVIDWPDLRTSMCCSMGVRWMPRNKMWKIL